MQLTLDPSWHFNCKSFEHATPNTNPRKATNICSKFVTKTSRPRPRPHYSFQTKTILFCSEHGYRPHYNTENDQRKRINSKTLSRVERFENGTVWKRCFPSVDGENEAIWKPWRHHNNTTVSLTDAFRWLPCWSLWFLVFWRPWKRI